MPTAKAAAVPRLSRSPRVSAGLGTCELVGYVCHEYLLSGSRFSSGMRLL